MLLTLLLGLAINTLASVTAYACKATDRNEAIRNLLEKHPQGKVLKVNEVANDAGCTDLHVRILLEGMVKVIVVKGD